MKRTLGDRTKKRREQGLKQVKEMAVWGARLRVSQRVVESRKDSKYRPPQTSCLTLRLCLLSPAVVESGTSSWSAASSRLGCDCDDRGLGGSLLEYWGLSHPTSLCSPRLQYLLTPFLLSIALECRTFQGQRFSIPRGYTIILGAGTSTLITSLHPKCLSGYLSLRHARSHPKKT